MINFVDLDARYVVGIRINGKITDQEFDAIAALLEKRMQQFPKVSMYVELESFGGMELKTFIKDLRFGLKNFDRFEKEAIVTKKKWVHKIATAGDKAIKDIDIKAFSFGDKDKAKKWFRNRGLF